jgi:radical SAM protein with 4Fe4S-binding SPASM domain
MRPHLNKYPGSLKQLPWSEEGKMKITKFKSLLAGWKKSNYYPAMLRKRNLFPYLNKYILGALKQLRRREGEKMECTKHNGSLAIWKKRNHYVALLKLLIDPSLRSMPQWISFQTTFVCNLRCPHCQTHGTEKLREVYNSKSMNMPTELLKKAGNEALPWVNAYCLSLSGEPLLTPDVLDVINQFSSFNAKLDLTTNGMLLTADMLEKILPFLGRVCFSVDGASKGTYERNRLGARYEKLITNVKLVTRVVGITGIQDIEVSLAYVVMGNNIRELPELIMLARFLGVRIVYGFFLIVHPENNMADEDVALHKALYNEYLEKALKLAHKHGIAIYFPPPFKDVDQKAVDDKTDRMREEQQCIDKDIKRLIDVDRIENDANRIAAEIKARRLATDGQRENAVNEYLRDADYLGELLYLYRDKLKRLAENPDATIKYCDFLQRRIYVHYDGEVAPCCVLGRPSLGNINNNTINEIWNGEKYNDFRSRFYSEEPYECCRGCGFSQVVQVKDFLAELQELSR